MALLFEQFHSSIYSFILLQSYPDEAHGLTSVQPHLYHTMDEFWVNCLNLGAEDE